MFELVMFDLDGTLVDTAGEISDTVNDVLAALRLQPVSEGQVRGWIGQGSRELLIRACAHAAGLDEAVVRNSSTLDSVVEMYGGFHQRRCGSRSHLYPQVAETLAALRGRGVRLAVVSNRERRFAEAVLRSHGLLHYFDPLVAGDTLPMRKPDPGVVAHCLRLHQVPAGRALLVGDSVIDVQTAHHAGVPCWAVPYGYSGGGPIEDAAPDRVIADISAVLTAVQSGAAHRHPAPQSSLLQEEASWP